MRTMMRQPYAGVSILLLALLAACAGSPPAPEEAQPVSVLQRATAELPPEDVININILVFEADVPSDPENPALEEVYTDIRAAEARYMPYQLRRVLEATGQWGDVRVIPESSPSSELEVSGRIIDSHGEELKLHINAVDASERVWLNKEYQGYAHPASYDSRRNTGPEDPFLDVYHRIANDLVRQRQRLGSAEKQEIQQIAELRFAAMLAPQQYDRYLQQSDDGRIHLAQSPPVDDPLLGRIELAAQRNARMVDVLDQYYRDFYQRMQPTYTNWRANSYQEMQNLRELRRQAQTRKALGILAIIGGIVGAATADNPGGQVLSQVAIAGGIYSLSSGIDKGRQQNIHVASLQELAHSLSVDLQPMNLQLRDRTVRLTGSAEEQYRQWRELLSLMIEQDESLPTARETTLEAPSRQGREKG